MVKLGIKLPHKLFIRLIWRQIASVARLRAFSALFALLGAFLAKWAGNMAVISILSGVPIRARHI